MKFFNFGKKNKIVVKKFNNQLGNSEIALLSFSGEIRDKIIEQFNNRFLVEGDHISRGGKSSPKTILSLIGFGGASVGIAGITSGQLFMATANPATLMAIGNGVGSAVMGSSGIIAQAPFIPITGALMPVVAPLIAFQTISTIKIMKQFQIVNKKLDDVQKTLNRIIKRDEATFIGEIISAANRINELEEQFEISNQFTNNMIIRLALLEDKINPIFERYNYLYQSQNIEKNITLGDLKFKKNDAFMTIIASILDMRIDILKLKLNIQENPGFMGKSARQLKNKVEFYKDLWIKIENNTEEIKTISNNMKETIKNMNWWQKNIPEWLGGKNDERKNLEEKSNIFEMESLKHQIEFKETIDNAMGLEAAIKQSLNYQNTNLIYWQDEKGEHSYYTDDVLIQ